MLDVHNHMIPGIDDGARDMDMSLAMALIAVENGIRQIIATPHVMPTVYDNDRAQILEAVAILNQNLQEQEIPLTVLPGGEYHLEPELPESWQKGELLSLNDNGRYLLVELPDGLIPDYTMQVLYELQLAGVTPVIAHPERNRALQAKPNIMKRMANRGMVFQVTSASITGLFGREVQRNAMEIITSGHVTVVGSDAHSARGRSPRLREASDVIANRFGEECADVLCYHNPHHISRGSDLLAHQPKTKPVWRKLGQASRLLNFFQF